MELQEIENKIACNELNAAQVFTQMKQHVDFARLGAITAFGAELLNEHERCFIGGENQIQAICQVVLEQVTNK